MAAPFAAGLPYESRNDALRLRSCHQERTDMGQRWPAAKRISAEVSAKLKAKRVAPKSLQQPSWQQGRPPSKLPISPCPARPSLSLQPQNLHRSEFSSYARRDGVRLNQADAKKQSQLRPRIGSS
jgi:hypothetical protein